MDKGNTLRRGADQPDRMILGPQITTQSFTYHLVGPELSASLDAHPRAFARER